MSPELEFVGRRRRLLVQKAALPMPSLLRLSGSDAGLNVAVALACLGFPRELVTETGFEVLARAPSTPEADSESHHYIGPYFRWEISGFWSTVEDEISLGGTWHMDSRAVQIIRTLKMDALKSRDPTALSGGETAKVVLAAHLIREPRFLVLDRVLGELDQEGHVDVVASLRRWVPNGIVVVIDDVITQGFDLTISTDSEIAVWTGGAVVEPCVVERPDSRKQLTFESFQIGSSSSDAAICVKRFSAIRFSRPVFNPVDCSASSGDLVVITGPNGSGKTSFLEGLSGLLKAEGRVTLKTNRGEMSAADFFALSPQDPQCDITEASVTDELTAACSGRLAITALLSELGLSIDWQESALREDMGLQKLTSVIAATIRGRPCCLLDEPALYLGSELRAVACRAIQRYLAEGGIVFCSSHDMQFVTEIRRVGHWTDAAAT